MKTFILFLLLFSNAQAGLLFLSPFKGAAFTPRSISGLKVWLTTSVTSSINGGTFSNSDPVSTWTDQSTNAYSFTASGGLRPTVQTNQLNAKPIIRSSASQMAATMGADLTEMTIFFVTNVTTLRQFDAIISNSSGSFPTGSMTIEVGSGTQFDVWDSNVGAKMNTGSGSVSTGTWYIGCITYSQSTPAGVFYLGNVSKNTTNQASMFLKKELSLFDDTTAGFTPYRGDTASFIIYDSVLSSGDRTNVYNYLKTEFGL
jgi:hypothetical protein